MPKYSYFVGKICFSNGFCYISRAGSVEELRREAERVGGRLVLYAGKRCG